WGLDVSGRPPGVGGIGGLLAMYDTRGTSATTDDGNYLYFYDGSGNVTQVLQVTHGLGQAATLDAAYDYTDPFGAHTAAGPQTTSNPFRFSTKYFDGEIDYTAAGSPADANGLYYYGYRYYSPRLGRWLSWDPIGEEGGLNLCASNHNNPLNIYDPLGLKCCKLEYRSSLVVLATHLGLAVDSSQCSNVPRKSFNVQFGPKHFPIAAGNIVAYPDWTSPLFEANQTVDCDKCKCLWELHTREYPAQYLLIGPNSNSALHDTVKDCGISLPRLRTPLSFFWGLTTDPGKDTQGR
ncbi:MAG: hypothetical protein GDA68_23375, partial [Nitrospira sp. CR2.1]|nr:hypothetical protein [Nitrospira sp. CR2.1]